MTLAPTDEAASGAVAQDGTAIAPVDLGDQPLAATWSKIEVLNGTAERDDATGLELEDGGLVVVRDKAQVVGHGSSPCGKVGAVSLGSGRIERVTQGEYPAGAVLIRVEPKKLATTRHDFDLFDADKTLPRDGQLVEVGDATGGWQTLHKESAVA